MTSQLQTITARVAAVAANVPGVGRAFALIPRVVQDAELPAIIVAPGAARYEADGEGLVTVTRSFQLVVLVRNAAHGAEGEYQAATLDFIEAVADYFQARPGLEVSHPPNGITYDARISADSGYALVDYPPGGDTNYYGATLTLDVEYAQDIAYQD